MNIAGNGAASYPEKHFRIVQAPVIIYFFTSSNNHEVDSFILPVGFYLHTQISFFGDLCTVELQGYTGLY